MALPPGSFPKHCRPQDWNWMNQILVGLHPLSQEENRCILVPIGDLP